MRPFALAAVFLASVAGADEFRVGTWNVEWSFDHAADDGSAIAYQFAAKPCNRELAIRGTADQGGGGDYDLDDDEQDVSDHFPLLAAFDTNGASAPAPVIEWIERLKCNQVRASFFPCRA